MAKVSFDHICALISLSINPDKLVKVTIKADQKLKYVSELKTLTSCQNSNEVRTVVLAAIISKEISFALFWGKYDLNNLTVY